MIRRGAPFEDVAAALGNTVGVVAKFYSHEWAKVRQGAHGQGDPGYVVDAARMAPKRPEVDVKATNGLQTDCSYLVCPILKPIALSSDGCPDCGFPIRDFFIIPTSLSQNSFSCGGSAGSIGLGVSLSAILTTVFPLSFSATDRAMRSSAHCIA